MPALRVMLAAVVVSAAAVMLTLLPARKDTAAPVVVMAVRGWLASLSTLIDAPAVALTLPPVVVAVTTS